MTGNVFEAVKNAREFFCIQDFPGNLFTLLEKGDYAEKYKMLLFKEDIGKLSGFIGYGGDGFTVICINYKRPIGHQNFTLAHELGHWFLHKGQNISDEDKHIYSGELQEKEASNFASEVLYPERFIEQDYCDILHKGLLQPDIRLIQLDDIFGAREELKKIRDRYYSWMRNPDYLQKMIEKGTLTREDIKKENFKKKDMGECELVAIAKASGGEYWLITNDKGRVYKHPDMNIFDAYSEDKDVVILSGEEWIRNIAYLSEDPQK